MISCSHWGMFLMPCWNIDGPVYADRVNGRLTFRDWDKWHWFDQAHYRQRKEWHDRSMGLSAA